MYFQSPCRRLTKYNPCLRAIPVTLADSALDESSCLWRAYLSPPRTASWDFPAHFWKPLGALSSRRGPRRSTYPRRTTARARTSQRCRSRPRADPSFSFDTFGTLCRTSAPNTRPPRTWTRPAATARRRTLGPYEATSGWSRKASDGFERRRGVSGLITVGWAERNDRREMKVIKERRAPRERGRMGTSVY